MTNEEIFNKNIKLAYKLAGKYLINHSNEYEDIKQIALMGLWKSVLSFNSDISKFSTYAYVVMSNDINIYLRHHKKHKNNISLYSEKQEGDNLTIEDTLQDDSDLIDEILCKLSLNNILNNIAKTKMQKTILNLRRCGYTQTEIAKYLGCSQAHISREIVRMKKYLNEVL